MFLQKLVMHKMWFRIKHDQLETIPTSNGVCSWNGRLHTTKNKGLTHVEFVVTISTIPSFEFLYLNYWSIRSELQRDPSNPFVLRQGSPSRRWDLNSQHCSFHHGSPYFRALLYFNTFITLRPLPFNNSWKSENRVSKSKIEYLALASI